MYEDTKILEKAKKIVRENRIKINKITPQRIFFTVVGDTSEHSVIFDREHEKWSCDCQWFSLKGVECSHILSVKLLSDKLTYNGSSPLWDMQVKFIPQSKAIPSKTLLGTALDKIGLRWDDISEEDKLRDDYGIFGINLPDFVLVAKDYVMADVIVSCHKRAVYSASNQEKFLLMYVAEEDAFFKFLPQEIIRCSFSNWKGTALMENFPITIGKKIAVDVILRGDKSES